MAIDRSEPLPPGGALAQARASEDRLRNSGMPQAVCYRIDDLMNYLSEANEKMAAKGIKREQRGIALVPGMHLGGFIYARGKLTIMLVATQFQEMDPKAGRVDMISNSLFKKKREIIPHTAQAEKDPGDTPDDPADIDDIAFDAGSLWP
jgi:hypothetical protein